jgi:hypothetical protein
MKRILLFIFIIGLATNLIMAQKSATITVKPLPGVPSAITGTTYICAGRTNVPYSVTIANATSYVWNYSGTGVTITGNGNSTIYISFSSAATNGNLTVNGSNSCAIGPISSNFPIVINRIASDAGVITGAAVLCANTNNVLYSAAASNATWSFNGSGASINGSGNSITMNFSAISTSGVLTVRGTSVCGNAAVIGNYPISVKPLPTIGTITGLTIVNAGTANVVYSSTFTNATSTTWSYSPSLGVSMIGTGASRIVTFSTAASSGTLTVNAINVCASIPANLPITIIPKPKTTPVLDEIYLTVSGENYEPDKTIIVFNNESSANFDGYDNEKLKSEEVGILSISTRAQDNVPLIINTLPNPNSGTIITLTFQTDKAGKYTLDAEKIKFPEAGVELYLEDTKTNTMVNLSQTKTYSFAAQPADDTNRFKLHFIGTSAGIDNVEQKDFVIYSFKNEVFVMKTTSAQAQVMIYDLQGRMIKNAEMNNSLAKFSIDKAGIYLVKMVSAKETLTKQVYIE